jgi:hypothetical protein
MWASDLVLEITMGLVGRGMLQFNAPYYGNYVSQKSIHRYLLSAMLIGGTAGYFRKNRFSFWIRYISIMFLILIPWISFAFREKSSSLGPVHGPLLFALPYLLARIGILSSSHPLMLLIAFGIYQFQPSLPIRSCDALTIGPCVAASLFCLQSIQKLRIKSFRSLLVTVLALCAFCSRLGLQYSGVQQCTGITSSLQDIVLQRSESVTGFVSVLRLPSEFGPIVVLRCDHSLIGGMYLNHRNSSIFGSFYYMDFVRYVRRVPTSASSEKRALQM